RDDREARLARLRYVQHGGSKLPDAAPVLADATRNLDRLAPADAAAILQALAEFARVRGNLKEALDFCRRWCLATPQDLRAFLLRFDLEERLLRDDEMR